MRWKKATRGAKTKKEERREERSRRTETENKEGGGEEEMVSRRLGDMVGMSPTNPPRPNKRKVEKDRRTRRA
jgi:hypothetical protein